MSITLQLFIIGADFKHASKLNNLNIINRHLNHTFLLLEEFGVVAGVVLASDCSVFFLFGVAAAFSSSFFLLLDVYVFLIVELRSLLSVAAFLYI